jgi:hypothetical protein
MYYTSLIRFSALTVLIFSMCVSMALAAELPDGSEAMAEQPDLNLTGNFSGYVTMEDGEQRKIGLIVTDQGDDVYQAVLHFGGLPWEQEDDEEGRTIELQGTYTDYTLRLSGEFPWDLQFILNRYTALDEENNYMGHLERVIRIEPNS